MIEYEMIEVLALFVMMLAAGGAISLVRYIHKKAEGSDGATKYSFKKAAMYYVGGVLATAYILLMDASGINEAVEVFDLGLMAVAIPPITDELVNAMKDFDDRNRELKERGMSASSAAIQAGIETAMQTDMDTVEETATEYHEEVDPERRKFLTGDFSLKDDMGEEKEKPAGDSDGREVIEDFSEEDRKKLEGSD